MTQHVPLVHVLRDGRVESVHYGSIVVLSPDGSVRFAAGEVDQPFYPRSAMKPVQASALVELGLRLPADLLALAAASHSGEDVHLDGARRILAQAGLSVADLRNPPELPYDEAVRRTWLEQGRAPSQLAQNCSGKHAAMLATARQHGWSLEDYLDPRHPVQQAVAAEVKRLCGEPPAHVATDGCGAPLFAVSLRGLAHAAGRIASAEGEVAAAMRAHPEMVAGSARDVTALMRAVPGLMAKDGFEGVQIAALADGTALAIKIADGSDRARLPITLAALEFCGVDTESLAPLRVRDTRAAVTFDAW
ncbi:asparaginase [Amycolatopsis suaedae]|uniref:Asparaginase n=1 Tax=Amycolatopsis suaedae TaxID=2510978 RepID=A0A4Q7IWF1_9PSEU|nr:asparaginase [Amycolatopsis suaedae]RZQ59241.1 asparaginase [Amycolatopsis suaedae]